MLKPTFIPSKKVNPGSAIIEIPGLPFKTILKEARFVQLMASNPLLSNGDTKSKSMLLCTVRHVETPNCNDKSWVFRFSLSLIKLIHWLLLCRCFCVALLRQYFNLFIYSLTKELKNDKYTSYDLNPV